MGAEFKDYDNDGLPDIFVTALAGETYPVFRNLGKGSFSDATFTSRLGPAAVKHSGWGIGVFDFNNDGWKDVFTANSHVNDLVEKFEPAVYREKNSVFVNSGGTFREEDAGLAPVRAHRGAAFADLNGDGRIDAVVSSLGEPAELWENVSPTPQHWIEIKLIGTKSNRDGIGAKVRIGNQYAEMTTAVGYASSAAAPLHFGLGAAVTAKIEVRWPGGAQQTVTAKSDQLIEIREER
jgi:hypothetical protein